MGAQEGCLSETVDLLGARNVCLNLRIRKLQVMRTLFITYMCSTSCHVILKEYNIFIQENLIGFTNVCYIYEGLQNRNFEQKHAVGARKCRLIETVLVRTRDM